MNISDKKDQPMELLADILDKKATKEQQERFKAWLKEDPMNQKEFEAYKAIWETSSHYQGYTEEKVQLAWERMEKRLPRPSRMRTLRTVWYSAAAVAVLMLGIFTIWDSELETIETAQGATHPINLADGTHITLNENSQLKHPNAFKGENRTISLEGEAFFEVARNPEKPFIIETENIRVQVLGTKFNVRAVPGENAVVVSVTEGKVALKSNRGESEIIIVGGEEGTYFMETKTFKKRKLTDQNFLGWKTRKVTFVRTPLSEAIGILSHAYHKKIVITPDVPADLTLSAIFDGRSFEEVLEIVSFTLNLEIVNKGDYYLLKKR